VNEKMKEVTLNVEGMSCNHCVNSIERGLNELDGIQSVKVYLDKKEVSVSYDESKTGIENIKDTILDLGYDILK
jgi:copper chaperone